ncbi:phosphoribosyl 1,2-cyclic phosphodiesterase [Hypnocyclicus thermotrophus]|uniref:Phosphoribosyl 1,2-cyclic phosphodiesterase n=1 Tax=Hypnocyclicus thermotrophus TaxID=1627895 RepID=A0AA46DX08_9FUSO|nr:MBL fold metallo-hydrolase [Hypnocyclicus thermotrophus]TDT67352.1 phosphoribosyl 1,2-cyclic phosphodiesterase [Hypnocyclicus thermotrophus]
MADDIKIKFWGVRGSHNVFGDQYKKYGGNTTCLSIEIGKKIMIFDAGTGIINYGKDILKNKKNTEINIFFTHTHIDHIQGLMYFTPIYMKKYFFNFIGSAVFTASFSDILTNIMSHQYFPVKFRQTGSYKRIYETHDNQIIIIRKDSNNIEIYNKNYETYEIEKEDIVVTCMHAINHPVGGVNIYKVEYKNKKIVFATDVESYVGGDEKLIEFSKNVDILIHDSAYLNDEYKLKQGWGHSTPEMAAVNAKKAEVKKLYLTHHSPDDTDEIVDKKVEIARKIFKESYLAYETLEIKL